MGNHTLRVGFHEFLWVSTNFLWGLTYSRGQPQTLMGNHENLCTSTKLYGRPSGNVDDHSALMDAHKLKMGFHEFSWASTNSRGSQHTQLGGHEDFWASTKVYGHPRRLVGNHENLWPTIRKCGWPSPVSGRPRGICGVPRVLMDVHKSLWAITLRYGSPQEFYGRPRSFVATHPGTWTAISH